MATIPKAISLRTTFKDTWQFKLYEIKLNWTQFPQYAVTDEDTMDCTTRKTVHSPTSLLYLPKKDKQSS